MKYVITNSQNYGQSFTEMTEEEYDALSDRSHTIPDHISESTIDDYSWRHWDSTMDVWIDDMEKKAELFPDVWSPPAFVPTPLTFEQKKAAAKNAVLMMRLQKQSDGCSWNGHTVESSIDSLTLINSAILMVNLGQWNNGSWKMADGSYVVLSDEDVISMASAVGVYIKNLFDREAILRTQIEDATDESGLEWTW